MSPWKERHTDERRMVMPGLLVLMGSGETSPTMVEVHRSVIEGLGPRPRAVLLDTPYAFQENAAEISARARRYFARSVGLDVTVGGDILTADWVFSGPGSPTYALDRWTATSAAADLRSRIRTRTGVTVLSSAAACTAGLVTVPVYEIYKVGAPPHWREGLNLLHALDLEAAVIPHYNNTEGGTHDTRYCYLGERRLARMEQELPETAAVLGIDEHTALIIDLITEHLTIAGKGALTIRRRAAQTVLPSGTHATLTELRDLIRGKTPAEAPPDTSHPTTPSPEHPTLAETTQACRHRFETALATGDAPAATQAILDLEDEISRWSADTEEDAGGPEEARQILRHLIATLGAHTHPGGPTALLAPIIDPLLRLREEMRRQNAFDVADALRSALAKGGVLVEDTPTGPRWKRAVPDPCHAARDEDPSPDRRSRTTFASDPRRR